MWAALLRTPLCSPGPLLAQRGRPTPLLASKPPLPVLPSPGLSGFHRQPAPGSRNRVVLAPQISHHAPMSATLLTWNSPLCLAAPHTSQTGSLSAFSFAQPHIRETRPCCCMCSHCFISFHCANKPLYLTQSTDVRHWVPGVQPLRVALLWR